MVDRASYKSIRDQLISLSVDIEDKAKICALLERKIENERSLLGQVEGSLNDEYDFILEAEIRGHKESSGQKTTASHKIMQYKSDLVTRCQELMDLVKEQERELSAEVRSVYKDAEQVIEAEKKNFRSGYEDRLQKFIAGKASEYKESTAKALHPEISRLQMMHEQELSAAQLNIQAEERSIQEILSVKLQARLEEERLAVKDELKLTAKALQDKSSADVDIIKREHRRQLQRMADDQERDLEKHRLFLKDKAQRGRDRAHAEMQQLQHGSQQRVADLQQRHLKHIENLQDQHEQEIQALRRQAQASSKNHQTFVRKQLQRGTGEYDDSDNEYRSSPPGKSKSTGRHSPSKISHSRGPNSTGSLHLDGFSDDEGPATTLSVENTAEEEIEIAAVVRAGQEERDKQLQAEIRALESETIRLERQWRARAEAEEKAVLATVAVEEDYLQVRRQRSQRTETSSGSGGAEGDVAELVVLREQLIQQLQEMKAQSERAAQEEQEVSAEIRTYREGVAAHKARISDKQEQHRLHLRELQLEAGPKLRELREQVDYVAAQIKDGAERCRRQVVAVDKEHAVELAKLDSQVKSEVGRREDEIESLRDAVEAETTKIVRLERLIKQYSSSDASAASSGQAVSGSGSGRTRTQDLSSNRSTASSYISAGSTTISGTGRLSAPRARPERTVSSGGAAAGLRASTSCEVESAQPSSRPSTGTRNRSLSSTSSGPSRSTARTTTASAVADGLQQLRLNRTTGGCVGASGAGHTLRNALKGDSGEGFEDNDGKSLSYDLSDDEEPLPAPSWMKPSKY